MIDAIHGRKYIISNKYDIVVCILYNYIYHMYHILYYITCVYNQYADMYVYLYNINLN